MEFKLNQILESTILLEGRKEDVIKKYGEEHTELINLLSDVDPSGNNKYLNWMVKTALGKNKDDQIPTADKIASVVIDFHKQLARIKNKDINSYKKLSDLEDVVNEAIAKEEEKKFAKQAKKIYEDDTVVVYAPFTVQASCRYGAGTKWCVSGTRGENNSNTFFDSYSKHSNFYFFMNKKMNANSNPSEYKYALQWAFDPTEINRMGTDKLWWDAQDRSSRTPPSWVTPEIMKSVEAFNPKHKKIKLGAQAKAFLTNPNSRDYGKFSDMLTPKQKSDVIDKIIQKGNLNSSVFSILSPDLTDKQKMDFITNYVKGTVNISDYKSMKNYLNKRQKLMLLQFNPNILNNYDLMKELNDEFTDEEKYELSKTIDNSLLSNTDSKVLFKKWSMSPEEREKHKQTSFYLFTSTEDDFVEKLLKVDPLNPDSYREINMLKLRVRLNPDISLYGIKTEYGSLDEYLGDSVNYIPKQTMDFIKSKATKL